MPTHKASGLVEPDIVVNRRRLTFAECLAVRVAVGNFRIQLTDKRFRRGLGEPLARQYDQQLEIVEHTMRLTPPRRR